MSRIRILSDFVVDRIAAGEVVERPASVVKELVENSLDAGATRVEVRLEDGGQALIEVIDDGHGMDRANAELAFVQHATSKIQEVDDLDRIQTLGFRGEALASIAAVGRVEMITSTGDGLGTRVRAADGDVDLSEVAAPGGTRIAVRDLFYNTPARRKHLRTRRTESGRVAATVEDFALLRPDVQFSLTEDGRERLSAPPVGSLVDRVHQVLGADVAAGWLPVEDHGRTCVVTGGITRPEETRATRSHVHLFINGRAVADGRLVHAITSAYDTALPSRRYPLAALFVQMDPDQVDVNVHPRKAEVRFVEPGAVYGSLRRAVVRALAEHMKPPELRPAAPPPIGVDHEVREPASMTPMPSSSPTLPLSGWRGTDGRTPQQDAIPVADGKLHVQGALQPLGQYANTYILAADAAGLLIIDQHVAHERVLFERVLAQRQAENVRVQQLLVPEMLELTGEESTAAEEYGSTLAAYGFELEPFGGRTWAVRAVPEVLGQRSGERVVRELLASLAGARGAGAADKLEHDVAASIACHSAVRANQPLSPEVMSQLVTDLSTCAEPMRCPHGRPVMLRMTLDQIEREIGRH